jgi:hypothetical protein
VHNILELLERERLDESRSALFVIEKHGSDWLVPYEPDLLGLEERIRRLESENELLRQSLGKQRRLQGSMRRELKKLQSEIRGRVDSSISNIAIGAGAVSCIVGLVVAGQPFLLVAGAGFLLLGVVIRLDARRPSIEELSKRCERERKRRRG